jgi:uncharacterized protein (DUF427 family)
MEPREGAPSPDPEKSHMPNRESLYHQYPDYRVDVEPKAGRVYARLNGGVIADSTAAVIVRETNLAPVIYFPRDDVRLELAEATPHRTFCPFKGEASYWTFRCAGQSEENLAWSYEAPFDQVAQLRNYVAFYPERVELSHSP